MSSVSPPRRVAFEVVRRVFEDGAWADRALRAAAGREGLEGRDRAFAQRLAYGSVQRRGTADHLISRFADRRPEELDGPVAAALRLGIFELLYMDSVPDHAAVDQEVELAKRAGAGSAAGFVNAVLRRVAGEGREVLSSLSDSDPLGAAVVHSCPDWLVELWWRELGPEAARGLLAAANRPAETAIRVNTLRIQPDELAEKLRAEGVDVVRPEAPAPLAPAEALVARGPIDLSAGGRFERGELTPQSRGSMAVVEVLDPQPGERILDLCAAPGAKATQIAARMEDSGEVVAVELDPGRASELRAMCKRMGATCLRVVEADAAVADLGGDYDRILVDPPCSDLGTLSSRPDVRWRKSPETIDRLAGLQAAILDNAIPRLRPGGVLVYSTCTISGRENEDQVGADARSLLVRPDRDGTDGMFIARIERGADAGKPGNQA